MRTVGIITEYNPLHNGHIYHINKSKEITGCDCVICVMSGNFIQRGQPALLNKWARTEMAVMNGADVVIELPVYYSLASAEYFAGGAVKLLDSLGIVDTLCFGSESGEISKLEAISGILSSQPESFKSSLCKNLKLGHSFPKAHSLALMEYASSSGLEAEQITETLFQPNNILGIEYIKALIKLKSKIKPFTIKRSGTGYKSEQSLGKIASATGIRNMLKKNLIDEIKNVMPVNAYEILRGEIEKGRAPLFADQFETSILTLLRKASQEELTDITDVTEGIENRIKKSAQDCGSLESLVRNIKTKRYTITRIQRILFSGLLGLTGSDMSLFNSNGGPQYIRILGFSKKGRELLGKIKSSPLPIVTAPHDFLRTCNPIQERMIKADITASDIFCLGYPEKGERKAGQDFYHKVITV